MDGESGNGESRKRRKAEARSKKVGDTETAQLERNGGETDEGGSASEKATRLKGRVVSRKKWGKRRAETAGREIREATRKRSESNGKKRRRMMGGEETSGNKRRKYINEV